MTLTLYGIPNCDTVKKARTWLDANGLAYTFHDYKKQGADPVKIAGWIEQAGLDKVVNRAGTTYRKLDDAQKAAIADGAAPAVLAEKSAKKQHSSYSVRPRENMSAEGRRRLSFSSSFAMYLRYR